MRGSFVVAIRGPDELVVFGAKRSNKCAELVDLAMKLSAVRTGRVVVGKWSGVSVAHDLFG